MRVFSGKFGLATLIVAQLGCEATPPPEVPTAPTPPVAAAPSGAVDLTPAPAPPDVVGVARWKNPGATLSGLSGCAGIPPGLGETGGRALIEILFGEGLRGRVDAKQLAAVVALDAPVDAIAALEEGARRPKVHFAIAVGLSSLERAKAAIEAAGPLNEVRPGVWSIGDEGRSPRCVVARSAGNTPARLVCGPRDKDLAVLTPYLARTAPTAPSGPADVHAELRWVPLDKNFGQNWRRDVGILGVLAKSETTGDPRFDKALVHAANVVGEELGAMMGDLDKVSMDLSVDPAACFKLKTSLELRGRTSWLAGVMTDRPERAGTPPAIFWRVPKDSDSAFYSRGYDPAKYGEMLKTLRVLVEGGLAKAGVGSPADRKALGDLLSFPQFKDAATVQASGHVDLPPTKGASTAQQHLDAMMSAYIGWYLVGVEHAPDSTVKWLRDLVGVYNRKTLFDPLRAKLGKDAKKLPTVKTVPAPAALGPGALDVEIAFTELPAPDLSRNKQDKVSLTLHILVMGDRKTTWIGVGSSRDEVVKRMVAAKANAPEANTLAARPGLESLKRDKHMSAGFLTIVPFTKAMSTSVNAYAAAAGGSGSPLVTDLVQVLNTLPHKGSTPFFVTTDVAGDAPRVDFTIAVQKGTVEDLGTLIMAGLKMATRAGALPGTKPGP
jgi:hypothetical protein